MENLGEMSISDFLVSDVNGSYTYLDKWNVDDSFKQKANKCGIIKTAKGYELCWGITNYGQNRYAIEYRLNGLVGSYTDNDGFNFQFVNSGMGTLPTDVTVKIVTQNGKPLTAENCGIWAFGFQGQIQFEDGQIIAYTEKPLSNKTDSVIVMVKLDKGVLTPIRTVNGSFEDVKNKAMVGSDYGKGVVEDEDAEEFGILEKVITSLAMIAFFVIGVLLIWRSIRKKRSFKKLYKEAAYYRESPLAGNLEGIQAMARRFNQSDDDGNLIAATFLKLINIGSIEPLTETSTSFFGREKESVSLRLVSPPKSAGVTARMLYDLLVLASGPDQILQEKEMEKYCSDNYTAMTDIMKKAKEDGENTLIEINCFNGRPTTNLNSLTERGKSILLQIIGFKKYLLDFSLIKERGINESIIWQDYLVIAALLGIADKAMEQFQEVYPATTPYQQNAMSYYYLAHRYQTASYQAAISAQARASGSGGSSSFGGGGGFSGGGSGGGTR